MGPNANSFHAKPSVTSCGRDIHCAKVVNSTPMGATLATNLRTPPLRGGRTDPVTAATAKQRMLKLLVCSDAPEQALRYRGFRSIAGVDEVGRGALFGPVVAAAVILPERIRGLATAGLKDSKQLTRREREKLDRRIRKVALAVSVCEIDAETIDRINIYQATRLAMLSAVSGLPLEPDHLLIDALRIDHPCPQTRLFYGDALSLSIAAASVVAKVHRDHLMRQLDEVHPGYGLASHKGYATPEHRKSLRALGPCALHRRSFAPVRALLPDTPQIAATLFPEDDPEFGETLFQDEFQALD
jgi:ribonuclease HII